MHRVGVNRFFWPAREDVLWYLHSDIITMIPPPTAVTSCRDRQGNMGQDLRHKSNKTEKKRKTKTKLSIFKMSLKAKFCK